MPKGWQCEAGLSSGNMGGFITVAKKDEFPGILPEVGESFLHLGYTKTTNTVMDPPRFRAPEKKDSDTQTFIPNVFTLESGLPTVKCGKKYAVTFLARGNRVKSVKITTYSRYVGDETFENKVTQTKRGTAENMVRTGVSITELQLNDVITVTDKWKKITTKDAVYSGSIPETIKGIDPRLTGFKIAITLEPGVGDFSIDDIQIIEK